MVVIIDCSAMVKEETSAAEIANAISDTRYMINKHSRINDVPILSGSTVS